MNTQKAVNKPTVQTIINGVDVGAVKETVSAVEKRPELAKFKFRLTNKWQDGGYNLSTVGNFYGGNQENTHTKTFVLEADEPVPLAGTDKGADPAEYLLTALASCLTTTLVYHAAVRGIKIDEVESDLECDVDLRGFLGLSDKVRKGPEKIRVNFRVKTDENNLDKLRALSKLSPIFDVISNGTNVDVRIERK